MLASYAVEVTQSRGRRFPESPHPYRNDFQRDRDRVIHARAFRRLEAKTQVFTRRYSDHFRNRLTHTLEVTQLTRTIAQPPPALYVQAGAFADQQNAQRLLTRLQAAGLERAFIALPLQTGAHLYRVRLGPIESVAQFDELTARLTALGVPDARLAIE